MIHLANLAVSTKEDSMKHKGPRFIIDESTGCWNWALSLDDKGYGRTSDRGRSLKAHRVVYEEMRGPIPDGLVIDHLCNNPKCVNPDHLEPVTLQANSARGSLKERRKVPATSTPDYVTQIRTIGTSMSQRNIAEMFGIGQRTVCDILKGYTWKEAPSTQKG